MKRAIWRNGAGLGGLLGVAAWVTFGPMGCGGAAVTTEADVLAVLEQPRTEEETEALADDGRRAYLRHSCHNCHGLDGGNPNGAPQLRNLYTTRAELTDHTQLDRDRGYVVRSILDPDEHVVAGHPQQMSPGYRFAPPEDLAAIVLYLERFSPTPPPE